MTACPNCSATIGDGDLFCGRCGHRMTVPPPPPPPVAPPPVAPPPVAPPPTAPTLIVPAAPNPTDQTPVTGPTSVAAPPVAANRRRGSLRPLLITGLITVLVVGIVGIVLVATSGGEDAAPEPVAEEFGVKPTNIDIPGDNVATLNSRTLITGTGAPAQVGDEITVHYVGVLASDGTEFDNSYDRGEPFTFTLGAGQVIEGWDQGLVGAREGERRQLDVPAGLAYGDEGTGGGAIGPGDSLTFVIDVTSIVAPPPATTDEPTTTTTEVVTVPPDPEAVAADTLETYVSSDLAVANDLVGNWVPQLSAKYIGLQYQGVNYTASAVLDDHEFRRTAYGAILVSGRDFLFMANGSRMSDWYFTVVPLSFGSKSEAQGWCDGAGIPATDCFPKLFPARA